MSAAATIPHGSGVQSGAGDANSELSPAAILEELDKVLLGVAFHNSDALRQFLSFVVHESLEGRGDQLKEYTIGVEVFHRKDSFDPRRDNIVRVQARRVRFALGTYYHTEGEADPIRIDLPNGGYRPHFQLAAAVPRHSEIAVVPLVSAVEPRVSAGFSAKRNRFVYLALLIAMVGLAVLYYFRTRPRLPELSTSRSIAVLPFRILGNDQQEDFFGGGLTVDLTESLAQIRGLRVVAPTSAFVYKGKAVDVRKVGKDLNVAAVLEGSIQRVDNRVRITAQLSDTNTGLHIWSTSYDRELKDVLQIQREISNSIASALGITIAGVQSDQSASDDEAYLKGRYFLDRPTLQNVRTAAGYFKQAIARDSSYAPAYAGLADAYALMPTWVTPTPTLIQEIHQAALRALSLDGSLGDAHVALAEAYILNYQWSKAENELKKASELSPGGTVDHLRYSSFLMKTGRLDEALAEAQKTLSLDPVSSNATRAVSRPLYFMGQYDRSIAQMKLALELDPNSPRNRDDLGTTMVSAGRISDGIAQIERAREELPDMPWYAGDLGWAYALAGNTQKANEILDRLLKLARTDSTPALAIARIYVGLGDKDHAFEWLEKALVADNPSLPYLKVDPVYYSLRSDPRYGALLHRMSLN